MLALAVAVTTLSASPGKAFSASWCELACGGGYSPTAHGDDTDGAAFLAGGISPALWRGLCVRAAVSRFVYYDQGIIGRAYFTPIGVGLRFYWIRPAIEPFVEFLPLIVRCEWRGVSEPKWIPGWEGGVGARIAIDRRAGIELGVSYVRSGGSRQFIFDGPIIDEDGLSQLKLQLMASVRVGRL